jgi:molybdenum cofactor guanylyltransferase
MEPFSGAVLAGGRSSRFGVDKARHVYRGKVLLAWVLESLVEADERFIVANVPYEFGVPVYGDLIPGGGSMSGLHTALVKARCDWLALAACDLPFLTPDYWRYLLEHRHLAPVVMVQGEEGAEPLAALYHRSVLPVVKALLHSGDVAMHRVGERAGAHFIARDEVLRRFGSRTLANINRPQDLGS